MALSGVESSAEAQQNPEIQSGWTKFHTIRRISFLDMFFPSGPKNYSLENQQKCGKMLIKTQTRILSTKFSGNLLRFSFFVCVCILPCNYTHTNKRTGVKTTFLAGATTKALLNSTNLFSSLWCFRPHSFLFSTSSHILWYKRRVSLNGILDECGFYFLWKSNSCFAVGVCTRVAHKQILPTSL